MKKIIASVLTAALFSSTFASAMTRTEFLTSTGLTAFEDAVPTKLEQNVDADILVKLSDDSEYTQGTVNTVIKSSDPFPTFDFKAVLYMDTVRELFKSYIAKAKALVGDDPAELDKLNNTPITGQFTVTVSYPKDIILPDYIKNEELLSEEGFSTGTKGVFKEISRKVETGKNAQTLTIVLDVVGPKNAEGTRDVLTCKDLEDNIETYLPDLEFECLGVRPDSFGEKTITGSITGNTVIGETAEPISTVEYTAVQKPGVNNDARGLSESIFVAKRSTSGGGGSSSSGGISIKPSNNVSLVFNINGKTDVVDAIVSGGSATVNLDTLVAPAKNGLKFVGWYYDREFTKPATGTITVNTNTVLYGKYVVVSGPDVFETDAHKLYIKGYPDGTVRPNGNITREEVAEALYRLLKSDVRDSITTNSNSFSDVTGDRWSNTSVSSMSAAGYINGYPDGTFGPAKPITRAEFAAIASRFFNAADADKSGIPYTDVPGHWAEDYIVAANNNFVIQGYSDGTFRPDQYITRAEAMTIINRMTVRHTDKDGVIEGMKLWPDMNESDWYYYEVAEATNSHTYVRRSDEYNEDWSDITE